MNFLKKSFKIKKMLEQIEKIKQGFLKDLEVIKDFSDLERVKDKYLNRKEGLINKILKSLKDQPLELRKQIGEKTNNLKNEIQKILEEKEKIFLSQKKETFFDFSKPGKKIEFGHLHPLSRVEKEVKSIFSSLNFAIVEGPEVETEYHNFDALNIPLNHPARDLWDTFWLKTSKRLLLRTHTSPVQIRYMKTHRPPFQIVVPGRVFRYEATDASHEINFYQLEGLMVGPEVSLANFKFIIEEFFKKFFEKEIEFRYRPSYFPFVEPGLEVDIKLKGFYKNKWLEVMGAGMVHPYVFEAVGYKNLKVQGFAFGLGLDRLAMIKYQIPDIRLFYSGDLRFINQF